MELLCLLKARTEFLEDPWARTKSQFNLLRALLRLSCFHRRKGSALNGSVAPRFGHALKVFQPGVVGGKNQAEHSHIIPAERKPSAKSNEELVTFP